MMTIPMRITIMIMILLIIDDYDYQNFEYDGIY